MIDPTTLSPHSLCNLAQHRLGSRRNIIKALLLDLDDAANYSATAEGVAARAMYVAQVDELDARITAAFDLAELVAG
jgi:hypothetical protein